MDDIAARREARRRRILENADIRLKKISSLQSNEPIVDEEKPNLKSNMKNFSSVHDHNIPNTPNSFEEYNPDIIPSNFEGNDDNNTRQPAIKKNITQNDTTQINRVYIILILGIVTRYLNLVFEQFEYLIGIDISFLHIDKIFIPLLIYECFNFYLCKPILEQNIMFTLMLSLNNIRSNNINNLLKIANYIIYILKDVSIYFFSFIIIDIAFSFVSKNI